MRVKVQVGWTEKGSGYLFDCLEKPCLDFYLFANDNLAFDINLDFEQGRNDNTDLENDQVEIQMLELQSWWRENGTLNQIIPPAPRRAVRYLKGRRPRFLVRRRIGSSAPMVLHDCLPMTEISKT